jgi:O2-independent ubiquinone biosynthesis accessory factor UbiT
MALRDEVKMSTGLPAPVHLMRAGLCTLPPPLISLVLRRISADLARNHATLLRRLVRMAPARVLFAPMDLPHRFLITITQQGVALSLAGAQQAADVTMRGSLTTLVDLLESRTDSDTVFFSRDLSVSGDIAIAVAFRNTLDGEVFNLIDDALAQLGPLARPAGRLVVRVHQRADRILARLASLREASHRNVHGGHDPVEDHRHILSVLDDLTARISKLEHRGRQAKGAA